MIARTQYKPAADDLALLLALIRTGTLAEAAQRLGVDSSTVFRAVQRLEKRIGQRLFERTRRGYLPGQLASALGTHAERVEAALEGARGELQCGSEEASGLVRVTTTDTFLQALVLPALQPLLAAHPQLRVDITATNEMVSLTRRDGRCGGARAGHRAAAGVPRTAAPRPARAERADSRMRNRSVAVDAPGVAPPAAHRRGGGAFREDDPATVGWASAHHRTWAEA